MASKKQKRPSVTRAPRQPRTPKVTEKTLGESIIEQMVEANRNLILIATALRERDGMLSVVTGPEKFTHTLAQEITQRANAQPLPAETIPGTGEVIVTEPPRKKRGRPSKAELAARAAAAEAPAEVAAEKEEMVREFPKACPCGVREDVPKHLHAKGCPIFFPAEPAPENSAAAGARMTATEVEANLDALLNKTAAEPVPAPTLDDVRATAIAFVGKHGKEKLAALLQKYAAEKLSSVATDKLPALLADLQAAG